MNEDLKPFMSISLICLLTMLVMTVGLTYFSGNIEERNVNMLIK